MINEKTFFSERQHEMRIKNFHESLDYLALNTENEMLFNKVLEKAKEELEYLKSTEPLILYRKYHHILGEIIFCSSLLKYNNRFKTA
jgi:hypothetical protein